MRKLKLLAVLFASLFFILGCSAGDASKVEDITDEPKEEVADETAESWKREGDEDHSTIATTVAITEIMEQLQIELVGIPTRNKELHTNYKDLPEVGIADDPDMETDLSLKPTDGLSHLTVKTDR